MHPEILPSSALTYLPELHRSPSAPLPHLLRSERVQLRSFEEHVEALQGAALDPLHLLLRSSMEPAAFASEDTLAAAAVLKAEHDLAQLSSAAAQLVDGWDAPLQEDLDRLRRHRPRNGVLKRAWHGVMTAIQQTLVPEALAA
ncbi:MAG: hypothetical protein VX899_13025 [Myxococcota bacterium]|nr:hypothetical protein [Myxococcota bacterium]